MTALYLVTEDAWVLEQVRIQTSAIHIRITAIKTAGTDEPFGDIAIDDVSIDRTACGGTAPTSAPGTTTTTTTAAPGTTTTAPPATG